VCLLKGACPAPGGPNQEEGDNMKLLTSLIALMIATAVNAETNSTTVTGTLYTGVNAIGGETTGIVVESGAGLVTELEIKDPVLFALAEKLDGKEVTAKGSLKIVPGLEVPDRRVLEVAELQRLTAGTTCKSTATDYRLQFTPDYRAVRVSKGNTVETTLHCITVMTFPGLYECYETNVVDAGYQVVFHDTSGVPPRAELYEVFFWGRKLLDTLSCLAR